MKTGLYKMVADYDSKFDLLSLRRQGLRTTFSLEAGNLAFDFTNREFVGIEAQNASQWLADLAGASFSPSKLTSARVGFEDKNSFVRLVLVLEFGEHHLEKELFIQKFEPVAIPAFGTQNTRYSTS